MKNQEWLATCQAIGDEASREVMHYYKRNTGTEEIGRGYGGDMTMQVDKIAEDIIIKHLKKTNENIKLTTEEAGVVKIGKGEPDYLVFADPLDGSFNFKMGIGYFGTSIAVLDAKKNIDVVGYTKNFVSKSEYYAMLGKGAFKNGDRVYTSQKETPENVMLECSYGANFDSIKKITDVFHTARHSRMAGAVAIDYCKVASGGFDALIYAGSKRYLDVVAGNFIIKEAGGVITDFTGNETIYKGNELLASDLLVCGNTKIRDYILGKK
ncbi:MAG: inositol monophosphatase family protein [Candidatus Undinarchaeales archaeon]|jgi:myo-inositol-1(or 4)-monophosphatase|nr:inositol monophosphatase family protein [Candidatus Undinarchaeales archaeon]